jgi:hypothetical protein
MIDHWDMMRLQSWAEYFGTFLDDGPKIFFFYLFRLLYCWPAQKWLLQTAFTVNKLLQVTVEEGQPSRHKYLSIAIQSNISDGAILCAYEKATYYAPPVQWLFSMHFGSLILQASWLLSPEWHGLKDGRARIFQDSCICLRRTLHFLHPEKNPV